MVGQQTGFQHEVIQRDGAIDPLAEPGSLLVDEVRHPRPPGDAVDAREHRPPEMAASHQLLAGMVDQAVRTRHRSQAVDRGVAAGETSGQHTQLVLDDLGATTLQIGEQLTHELALTVSQLLADARQARHAASGGAPRSGHRPPLIRAQCCRHDRSSRPPAICL